MLEHMLYVGPQNVTILIHYFCISGLPKPLLGGQMQHRASLHVAVARPLHKANGNLPQAIFEEHVRWSNAIDLLGL